MIKVFIKKLDYSHIPILYPNLGFIDKQKSLFINEAFRYFKDPVFEVVDDASEAEYFLIPHDYYLIEKEKEYLKDYILLSEKYNKKILVFTHTDYDKEILIPNSIIFCTSKYGYKKKDNEIIMPAYVEDLLGDGSIKIRQKSEKPVVGFCGWASLDSFRQKISFYIKYILSVIKRTPVLHRKGLWFRKRAIHILEKSTLVKTNFLIRKTFSGHKATISINPEQARVEYKKNMIESDFVLCVKGDGNFSLRFFEALSLGRISLFVNTDCVLPLEDIIDYKKFVVFVDYKDLNHIDYISSDFYKNLSDEEFVKMQKQARAIFEKYLRIDSFFNLIPDILKKYE